MRGREGDRKPLVALVKVGKDRSYPYGVVAGKRLVGMAHEGGEKKCERD